MPLIGDFIVILSYRQMIKIGDNYACLYDCKTVAIADTVKPVYNDQLMRYYSAFRSSSRWPLQKADIVDKSKLVPSVFIKTKYWMNHR